MGDNKKNKVLIIGGGVSGITLARKLALAHKVATPHKSKPHKAKPAQKSVEPLGNSQDFQPSNISPQNTSHNKSALTENQQKINEVFLVEQKDRLGGVYDDVRVLDTQLDIGNFIFPADGKIFEMFPSIKSDFKPVDYRPGRICDEGLYTDYPVNMRRSMAELGLIDWMMIAVDIALSKLLYWRKDNAQHYIKYYIGQRLFKLSGLGIYIRRLFGVPASKVHASFPRHRMSFLHRKLSIKAIITRFVRFGRKRKFADGFFNREGFLSRQGRSFTDIFRSIEEELRACGVKIFLEDQVFSIKKSGSRFRVRSKNFDEEFDSIISTGALDTTYNVVFHEMKKLTRLDLATVYLRVKGRPQIDYNVVFNFRESGLWKRAMFVETTDEDGAQSTDIIVETTFSPDERWTLQGIAQAVKSDFNANHIGRFDHQVEIVASHMSEHAYPLYSVQEVEQAALMAARLGREGVLLVGREGQFRYTPSAQVAINEVNDLIKKDLSQFR